VSIENPEEVLASLLLRCAHPKRAASLRLIDAICREQAARRSTSYSVNVIGELSKDRGGPGTQALRNRAGQPYRELIAAHAGAARAAAASRRRRAPSSEENFLEGITSHLHRERARGLLAEVGQLRVELNRLKMTDAKRCALPSGVVVSLEAGDTVGANMTAHYGTSAAVKFIGSERDALATVLDPEWQRANGLSTDVRGRVRVGAQTSFPIGFLSMLAKVAAALGNVDGAAVL